MGALKSKNNKAPSQSIQTSIPKFERSPSQSQSGTDLGSEGEDIRETPPPGQRPPPFAPFPINDPDNFNLLQEEYRQTLNFQGNQNIDTTNSNNNNHKTKASHKNNSNIHASHNKVWWRLTHAQKNNANASSARKSGNGNGTTNIESENSRNRMGNIMDDRLTPDKNAHFGSPPQQGAVVAATVRHAPQYGAPLRGVSVPDPRHAHTTHNHHHRHQHHHRTPSRGRDRDTKRGQANGSRRHLSSSRSKSKEDKNRLIYAWLEQNEKVNKVLSKRGATKPAIAHPVLWEAPDSSSSGNSRSVTAIGATVVDANVEESDPSNSREIGASRRSHKVVPVPITNLNTANADPNPQTDFKNQSDLVSPYPHPHPPTPHTSLQRNEPFLSISPLFTDRDKKKLLTVYGHGRDPKSRSRSRSKSRLSRDPDRDRNRNLIPAAAADDDDDEETEEGTGLRRSSKGASSNSNSGKPNKRPKTKNGKTMRERIFQVLNDKDKYYGKLRTRERERDRDRARQGTSRRLGRDREKEREREDDSFREEERGRSHLDKQTKKQSSKSRHRDRDRDRDFDESRRRHRNSPNRLIYEKEYKHGSKNTKRKNPNNNGNGKGRSTDRDRDRRFSRHPSHHHRGNKKSRLQVLQVRESGQFKIKTQQKNPKFEQEQEQTVVPRPTESDQDRLRVEGETRRNILDIALKKEINEQQSVQLKKAAPPPPPAPVPPPDPQITTSVSVRDEPGTSSSPPKVTITLAAQQQDTPNNTRSSLSYVRTPPGTGTGTGTVASLNKKLPKKRMWSTSPPPPEPRAAPDTKTSSGHNADPRTADQVEDDDDNDEEDAEDENENDDDEDDENISADPISPPSSLPGISKPRARSPTQGPAPASEPVPAALNLNLAPSPPDLIDILEQEKKSDYHENLPTLNMNNSHRTSQHGDGFPSNTNNNRDPHLSNENDQGHRQRRYRGDAVANALDLKIDFSLIKTSIQRKEDRRLRFRKNNLFKFSKNSAQDFEADKNKNVIVYKADMDHDGGGSNNNNKGKVSLHRTKNATDFLNSSRGCHPPPPPRDEAVTLPPPPPLVAATKELLENQALENRLRSVAFKLTAFMETQKQTDTTPSKLKPFHPDTSPTAAHLTVRDESNRRQVNSGGDFENQRVTLPDLVNKNNKIQKGQKKEPIRGENPPDPRAPAPAQNGLKLSGCYLDPKKFSKLLTVQLEKLRDKQAIAEAEAEAEKIKNSERDFKKIKNATEEASREITPFKTLPEMSSHVPEQLKTILKRAQENSLSHPANPTTPKMRVKNSGAEESPPRDESGGDRKSAHGKRAKRLRKHRKTHSGKDSHKNIRSGKKKHRHHGHNHHHHSRHHHHHHHHHNHEDSQHRRSKSKMNTTSIAHNAAQASDTDASSRRKKSPAVKIIADPSSTMFTISSKIGEPKNGKLSPANASHGLPKVKGFGGRGGGGGGGGGGGRGKGGNYSPDNESAYSASEAEGGYGGYPYGGRDSAEDYYGSSGGYDGSQGYEDSFEDDSTKQTVTKSKSTVPADDVPKMTTTEAGGICFKLPGRVTHKTTIKVAHFPRMLGDVPGAASSSSAPAAPAAPAADGPICINLPGSCWDPCTCWEQPCRGCGGGGCSHCRGTGCCPNPCCRNLYCPVPCCPGQGGSEPSKQLNNCNVYNFGDPENYCTANVNPLNPNPFGCANLCDK